MKTTAKKHSAFRFSAPHLDSSLRFLLPALLAIWATAWLMLPSNPLDRLPGRDNGVFLYGGQQILLGHVPYVDFWDHKGPVIYYINALGLLLGSESRWGVWGLEFLFMTFTSFLLYKISERQWGSLAAMITLGFWMYAMRKVGPYYHFQDSNYTETYSLLFNVLAVFFWTKISKSPTAYRYYLLIGAMAGLSFMLRPNNIGIEAGIVLSEFIRYIRQRDFNGGLNAFAFLSVGVLTVVFLFVSLFFFYGALPNFFDAFIVYNLIYSHSINSVSSWSDVFAKGILEFGWLPLLSYFIIIGIISFHNYKSNPTDFNALFIYFLILTGPIEVLLSSISGRILLHYYIIWVPYIAWLIGASIFFLFPFIKSKFEKRLSIILPAVALLFFLIITQPEIRTYWQITNRLLSPKGRSIEKTDAVVKYVTNNTSPKDTVLVWGNEVWINFLSRRVSPTKYAFQYPLFLSGYTDNQKISRFLSDLRKSPPALIVEPRVDLSEMLPINTLYRAYTISNSGLPDGMDNVFEYIDANYCIALTTSDVLVYAPKPNPHLPCP